MASSLASRLHRHFAFRRDLGTCFAECRACEWSCPFVHGPADIDRAVECLLRHDCWQGSLASLAVDRGKVIVALWEQLSILSEHTTEPPVEAPVV